MSRLIKKDARWRCFHQSMITMIMTPHIKLDWVKSDRIELNIVGMICDKSSVEQINKERCQMVLSPPIPCHSIKLLYLDFPLPNFDFLHQQLKRGKKWRNSSVCSRLRIKDFCHIWLRPVFVAILESCITLHAPFALAKKEWEQKHELPWDWLKKVGLTWFTLRPASVFRTI